jgi:hypothetical protein
MLVHMQYKTKLTLCNRNATEIKKLRMSTCRHSAITDAAILEDAGWVALSGLRCRHLHRGH